MRTTAKRNPITGDPVNNSSFPGSTGSEREKRKNAAGTLTRKQNKAINQGVDKQTGKIQYKGIPTKGEVRREERSKIKEGKKFDRQYRRSRGIPSKFDAAITKAVQKTFKYGKYDTGGKKGQVIGNGEGGTGFKGQGSRPKSCRGKGK